MTHTIELAPEQERTLAARAARNGQTLDEYLHDLVQRDLEAETQAMRAAHREAVRAGYGKFAHVPITPELRRQWKDEELHHESLLFEAAE